MTDITKLSEYSDLLHDLKQKIKTGQIKSSLSVNSYLIMLYWDMGRQIVEKQEKSKWGSGFIDQLSKDLKKEFPEMTGFSAQNLRYMRVFYIFYSQNQICAQPVLKLQDVENELGFSKQPVQSRNSTEIVEQTVQQFVPQEMKN